MESEYTAVLLVSCSITNMTRKKPAAMRGPGAAASGDATKGKRRQPGLLEMEDAAFKGPPFAQKFRKAKRGEGVVGKGLKM